ncbi:hypothetical protein [Inediibacterium massiliense]|uniref:hypothetical protein n=1 Tax=Inediibacterium massiliense TaxID=1658111 RepID=UPI0006B4EA65|nr:hypothetical protein [Inediibacterium massiliense]
MKKTLLFFLILVTIMIYGKIGFVDANAKVPTQNNFEREKNLIEQLFEERVRLWNEIYKEDMDQKTWIEELQKIVTDPLLSFDEEAFRQVYEYPTDMDKVLDVKILNIGDVVCKKNEIKAKVNILWKMESLDQKYKEEITYTVLLNKEDGRWKISDYNVNE